VYRSRLRHYKALSSAERRLTRDSESPTEDTTYASLDTDVEMEVGAPRTADPGSDGMEFASDASCNEDGFFSPQSSMSGYTDDASSASEEDFPDGDTWNQYNEDEELDAEVRFRKFEEMLDAGVDVKYEGKSPYSYYT
jgi:hypothetical protein